jgi:enhancing lycopene biosynthesis protein 2
MAKKVAVVLCGCGRGDGSEITEAVSCLIHLSRLGLHYACFAPDAPQSDVINHLTGKPAVDKRNQLVEAARIARGEISSLSGLDVDQFDAVVFPGGYGAAKNLCSFAADGPEMHVIPDVQRVIKGFHTQKKPIALCCIAPVLAAQVLGSLAGGPGCEVTIGGDSATATAISRMGSRNVAMKVTEAHVDQANRVYTTPAYMCEARPHEVYEGVGKMIEAMAGALG